MSNDTQTTPAETPTPADTILSRLGNRIEPMAALCLRKVLDGKADAGETHRIVSELVALIPSAAPAGSGQQQAYRKKPVVVDAVQWFPGTSVRGVCGDDPKMICGCVIVGGPSTVPHVHTTHGGQAVLIEPGDWIIAEPNGVHFYPVKPDIFSATYEPAAAPIAPPPAPAVQPADVVEQAAALIGYDLRAAKYTPGQNYGTLAERLATRVVNDYRNSLEVVRRIRLVEETVDDLMAERDKLAAFKAYVHKRLDDAGVPVDPESTHKAEGCRIGGRLDAVFAESAALAEQNARLVAERDTLKAENATALRNWRGELLAGYQPRDDWHEDDGPVLWLAFDEGGYPDVKFGTLIDTNPPGDEYTHWFQLPNPPAASNSPSPSADDKEASREHLPKL